MSFFCGNCNFLKDPNILTSIDYFEFFGIKQTFNIDQEILDKRFHDLQRVFHPDKFASGEDEELIEHSNTYSSYINNGYNLLKNDLERAKYILEKQGHEVLVEQEIMDDMELLQHIMETREQIENADSTEALKYHKKAAEEERNSIVQEISFFISTKDYAEAKNYIIKLKYHNRILEAIDEKEREFL